MLRRVHLRIHIVFGTKQNMRYVPKDHHQPPEMQNYSLTSNILILHLFTYSTDIAAGLPVRGDRGGDAGERDRVSPRARLLRSGGREIPLRRRHL